MKTQETHFKVHFTKLIKKFNIGDIKKEVLQTVSYIF